MNSDILELKKIFKEIQKRGYVESKNESYSSVGSTFEELIGKNEENFAIPDYKSIEIKAMREKSTSKLHLFNATPDGDYLFPIKRVLNTLGYPDRINKNYRVFNVDVDAIKYKSLGLYKRIRLSINRKEKKVELCAIDINGNDLEVNTSWSFKLLEETLRRKLKYLALIIAKTKIKNGKEHFYYKKLNFYELKDMDTFIDLLEKGIIVITFKIGVYRSGIRKGQIHDRGTGFSIDTKNLEYLYKKIK